MTSLFEGQGNATPLLQAALEYAGRGWHVLPLHSTDGDACTCGDDVCKSPGKHPRTRHGLKEASTDPVQIAAWWQQWPDANIGIVTGLVSGLVVLDVDPKSNGEASLRELVEEHGGWVTVTAVTGSGGLHALFRHPGQVVRNSASKVGRGIDVRGDGGYIVAAPSLHASGRCYAWADGRSPADVELADMPAWLLERATATRKPQASGPAQVIELPSDARLRRARAWLARRDPAVEGSGGDHHTFTTAAFLREFALTEDEAFSLLWSEWNPRCSPPWDEKDLREKVRNAYRYAENAPGGKLAERHAPAPRQAPPPQRQQTKAPQAPQAAEPEPEADPHAEAVAFLERLPKLIQADPRAPMQPEAIRHLALLHGTSDWLLARDRLKGHGLREVTAAVKKHIREQQRAAVEAMPAPDAEQVVIDPKAPLTIARQFLAARYTHGGRITLISHRGDWRYWTGSYYRIADPAEIKAAIYEFLEGALVATEDDLRPCRPGRTLVEEILHALSSIAFLDGERSTPSWLDGRPDRRRLVAARNGLLDIEARRLEEHDPAYFNGHALPYQFDPAAPEPTEWLRFMGSIWPGDEESINTLQEIFGYVLSGETSEQKIFLLVGDKRSGKGTIARVLRHLIGESNVASPTLSSLTTNFGLQVLLDRPLAVIGDARLSSRVDQAVIVERLLSISGEDALTVDRKHKAPVTVQLPSRFLILTNEMPQLTDASGALASRLIVLHLPISWHGREDKGLFDRLLAELPSILNWALSGYAWLRKNGSFRQPASALDLVEEFTDMVSPVQQFIREECIVESDAAVPKERLFDAWQRWCAKQGRNHPGTLSRFGRDLRAAVPELRNARPRGPDGERLQVFGGIRLRDAVWEYLKAG